MGRISGIRPKAGAREARSAPLGAPPPGPAACGPARSNHPLQSARGRIQAPPVPAIDDSSWVSILDQFVIASGRSGTVSRQAGGHGRHRSPARRRAASRPRSQMAAQRPHARSRAAGIPPHPIRLPPKFRAHRPGSDVWPSTESTRPAVSSGERSWPASFSSRIRQHIRGRVYAEMLRSKDGSCRLPGRCASAMASASVSCGSNTPQARDPEYSAILGDTAQSDRAPCAFRRVCAHEAEPSAVYELHAGGAGRCGSSA